MPSDRLVKWALPTAMKTIQVASRGRIPGTWLVERPPPDVRDEEEEERRRAAFGTSLAGFDEDKYRGRYHTDQTIPAEYFDPSPTKPANADDHDLVFTYLHRESDEDYRTMGLGEEILAAVGFSEPKSGIEQYGSDEGTHG